MHRNEEYIEYCKNGNFEGVYTCIKNGIDLEQRDESYYDFTGLIHASYNGYKSIVDILLEFQVNTDAIDTSKYTALMYASEYGRLEIVEKLI